MALARFQSESARPRWRRWLSLGVVAASLGWVVFMLRGAWDALVAASREVDAFLLLSGLACGMVASYLGFLVFKDLFASRAERQQGSGRLAHLYFVAQLMRHLPGRFFGIAYQVSVTRNEVPAGKWIAINGIHMLLVMYVGVAVSVSVLVGLGSVLAGVALLAAGHAAALLLRPAWLVEAGRRIAMMRFPLAGRIGMLVARAGEMDAGAWRRAVWLALLSWTVYFIAWVLYAAAHPQLDARDGLMICAIYSMAWLAGYLSLVTPSGLGVRELAFVTLAMQLPPSVIAYSLVVGRLSLLVTDVLLGAAFLVHGNQSR